MTTTRWRSHTLADGPNSRLNTPIVPGPQTSWVISTSALIQTLSPACTRALPAARARIFSVSVIKKGLMGAFSQTAWDFDSRVIQLNVYSRYYQPNTDF